MSLNFGATYEKAFRLFEAGRYPEAEDLYLKLVQSHGKGYADIYNRLGLITAFQGQIETAAEWFLKAVQANPRYTEASLNLAVTYADLNRYDDAQLVYDEAARLVKASPHAVDFYVQGRLANEHAGLGDRYANLGLWTEALEEYRKALALCPGFPDIVTKVGIVLREQGAYDEAIRVFLRAKEISPGYTVAGIHLGLTYYMSGFPDLAREEWESLDLDSRNDHHASVYLSLARKDSHDPDHVS
ncbi:MAG: tetratricopeptide repeat protein [Nitrospiria bacterium]